MAVPADYGIALAVTLSFEMLVALFLVPRGMWGVGLATCLLANLFTHPLGYGVIRWDGSAATFAICEGVIASVEAAAYRFAGGFGIGRGLGVSAIANGVTAIVSLGW